MKLWTNSKLRLVLTAECNMNCFYCHNEGQPKTHKYFSNDLFNHVISIVKKDTEKLKSVKFTGGEPLLHPNIVDYVDAISPYVEEVSIVTNGVLLTRDLLQSLKKAGLSRMRIGVDSLYKTRSRPTKYENSVPIMETLEWLLKDQFPFELNVVITSFNKDELPAIIRFCKQKQISAKFIEMVKIETFGSEESEASLHSAAQFSFYDFEKIVTTELNNPISFEDPAMKGANYVFQGENFEIRYCRHLCDYDLCYTTGTRIDPDGIVHTCMGQRGKFKIQSDNSVDLSMDLITKAVIAGCQQQKLVDY